MYSSCLFCLSEVVRGKKKLPGKANQIWKKQAFNFIQLFLTSKICLFTQLEGLTPVTPEALQFYACDEILKSRKVGPGWTSWKLGNQIGKGLDWDPWNLSEPQPFGTGNTASQGGATERHRKTTQNEEREEKWQRQIKFRILEPLPGSSHLAPSSMNLQDS